MFLLEILVSDKLGVHSNIKAFNLTFRIFMVSQDLFSYQRDGNQIVGVFSFSEEEMGQQTIFDPFL